MRTADDRGDLEYLEEVSRRFELDVSVVTPDGDVVSGPSPTALASLAEDAAFLVNISGNLDANRLLSRFRRRAYVDVDPGYSQYWHEAGKLGSSLARHNAWFTVGQNVGTPACPIPTSGYRWHAVRPPVVLSEWPLRGPLQADRLTTVASWRGAFGPVEVRGRRYGVKAHQWRRVLELPLLAPQKFEIALAIDPTDDADRNSLVGHGWNLVDPTIAAGNPDRFRSYVQESGGEFSVAQGIYVETNSGWFSDRTAAYLASGKPVLVEDTGFTRTLPSGEGLIAFRDLQGAVKGAMRIAAAYDSHARAARQLAESYFDSDVVLKDFLAILGVDLPPTRSG
jgi:hypothetical protein